MSEQYQYNEIPQEFEITIYTHYCYHSDYSWNIGKVSHTTSDMTGDNYLCIAETKVKIKVPAQKTDIKQLVINALKEEKKKQMAEYHKRMFELQEKIDSLLCLTYQPRGDEAVIDATANELPF